MLPKHVYELTHKEFCMICEEQVEVTHDQNEKQAMYAIMYAAASRGKGKKGKLPKLTDLYDRQKTEKKSNTDNSFDDAMEKQKHAQEWLSNFDLSSIISDENN